MYWKLFLGNLEEKLGGFGRRNLMRSGMMTGAVIGLLVAVAGVACFEAGKGNYHRLREHLETPQKQEATPPRPGGQDPVVLTRSPIPGGLIPEFLSATILPGRGMNVLQISAYLPARGEVNLLASTDVAGAAKVMTGVGDDTSGTASLSDGSAFLVPWAGRLGGLTSVDGKNVTVTWKGQLLNVPANTVESAMPVAYGGLLLNVPSSSVAVNTMPDGGSIAASFNSGSYGGSWPSKSETRIGVLLGSRSIEITVDVKNTGDAEMPVGIGWAPRFLIPGGDRTKVMLRLPAAMRSEVRDRRTGLPAGELKPVAGTRYDFNSRNGAQLGSLDLDDTFMHLTSPLDLPPSVELRDPAAKFGLRMTALSPTIRAVHVLAPARADFVSISPQMNYDDPLGRGWPAREDTGMAELAPGQTVEWKIRLELFPLVTSTASPI